MKEFFMILGAIALLIGFCIWAVFEIKQNHESFERRCHEAGGRVIGISGDICVGPNGILPIEW